MVKILPENFYRRIAVKNRSMSIFYGSLKMKLNICGSVGIVRMHTSATHKNKQKSKCAKVYKKKYIIEVSNKITKPL